MACFVTCGVVIDNERFGDTVGKHLVIVTSFVLISHKVIRRCREDLRDRQVGNGLVRIIAVGSAASAATSTDGIAKELLSSVDNCA
jgi:hypothetical protein